MGQLVKPNNPIGARWDKLKSCKVLKEDILNKISASEKFDEGITLDIGPQLLHTLRHPSLLRCVVHASSKLGEIFTAHYNKGAVQSVKVWTLESKNRDGICKHVVFETESEITSITYVSKHRVYLAFCSDLTLRVFTDSNRNFVEVHSIPCLTTILCLIYNKEDDEVYAGGIGILEEWKIQGSEHAASVVPGRRFFTDLTRNEWIRDIQTDKQNNQMFALHGNGICILNFKTRKQMHRLPNRHDGPLKCCCYYPQNDYLVTGGADGKIKLFNGTVFNLLHVFLGHHGPVTSLEPHKKDTLLFSSSHDGTVRIWRMDSLQIFMRLDIGEKIMHLALLSNSEFYFRTEKDIMIYSLNQFYQMFAPVESETKKLVCCRGKLKPNRILGSTEDGSVRVFSPVTGLTLTIIYPMPSFQVLTSFAYDIHQDKMHTVLTGGRVLVYNTVTNPCKAEEIWTPNCEDEEVNNLLLVTVEFMCEDGMDMDNLVFAGLKNGQIILCEAVVCTLEVPVQAHEGALTCLESCLHLGTVGHSIQETSSIILSGGTDNFIKIWSIDIDCEKRRPIVKLSQMIKIYLPSFPSHICMFANIVSVSIMANTRTGPRWRLIMFQLISPSLKRKSLEQNIASGDTVMPLQITHSEDEDHSMELTALDKCPIMKVVLTAGKDGFVKVWNSKNELLREMNFATPIYASCFANDRGDILVGYGTHICSVSVVNYLPLDCLKNVARLANIELKDDARELPVKFDPKCEPWLDLSNLNQYSIDIYERRRKHLEEEVIERFKRATEKDQATTKFVIFVDGGTTKVIRKDFADRLLNWAKGKSKLINKFSSWKGGADLSSLTEDEVNTETRGNKINEKRKGAVGNGKFKVKKEEPSVTAEPQFLDSEGLIEIYPSAVGKALRRLGSQKVLGLVEMKLLQEKELLKKEPIIAPDGYIPNSVIRRKLKPPPADPNLLRRVEKPFKLKPVPKVNPDHLPSWWGKEDEKEMTPKPTYRVMKWEDSPASSPRSEIPSVSSVSIESLIESPVKRYIEEGKSKTTTPKSPTPRTLKQITPRVETKSRSQSVSRDKKYRQPVENVKRTMKMNKKNVNNKKKKSGWDDSSLSERPDTNLGRSNLTSALSGEARRSPELSESQTGVYKAFNKMKPGTPTAAYVLISPSMLVLTPNGSRPGDAGSAKSRVSSAESVKSKRLDLTRVDLEMGTPDSRRGRRSGGQSVERTKSFKLTNLAVDEDSSMIHIKETKSGRRIKANMNSGIIQQLIEEKWMPKLEEQFEYEDVLDSLITVLDNNNPIVYDRVCTYLKTIFKELGIPEDQMNFVIDKLGGNLNNINTAIRKHTLVTLQVLGLGRKDVIMLVLPILIDPDEIIAKVAAETIEILTGVHDKEALLSALTELGITGGIYNSKEDEELTLRVLAERFAEQREDPQYYERILDWVEGTTPGLCDMFEEDRSDNQLWQEGSRKSSMYQGKECSFVSDGGKSVLDMINYDTSGRNTMYADLPATPGYSSDADDLNGISRGVSRFEAKSTGLKSEKSRYNARMELFDRGGASVVPSDRWEQPTPVSDIENDQFMEERQLSPFMEEQLLNFEKSNLTNITTRTSPRSYENMLLTERTLTDLSLVGPLPKFLPADNVGRNFDDISTDSAFESSLSVSEYAHSHFSEKMTVSHLDQQSSKHSQLSEENNMFDVEQVSNLEYEGDFDTDTDNFDDGTDNNNSMTKHDGLSLSLANDVAACAMDETKTNSMSSDKSSQEYVPREITVLITPRESGKKEATTPRKRAETESTMRRKLNDGDGFSTISDKSFGSIKSRNSESSRSNSNLSHLSDFDADVEDDNVSEPIMSVKIRNSTSDHPDAHITDGISLRQDDVEPTVEAQDEDVDLDFQKLPTSLDDYTPVTSTQTTAESLALKEIPVEHKPSTLNVSKEASSHSLETPIAAVDTPLPITPPVAIETAVTKEIPAEPQETPPVPVVSQETSAVAKEPVVVVPIKTAVVHLETPGVDPDVVSPRLESVANSTPAPLDLNISNDIYVTQHTPDYIVNLDSTGCSPTPTGFTPKDPNLYKYYDQQENSKNGVPVPGLHEEEDDENKDEKLPNRDSDIHTISNVSSNQITERLSGQDSGIARDMSEFSYGRGYARGFRPGAPLSPVKSGSEISSPVPHLKRQQSPKDWRKFFDLPNAVERRRMEQIKKEMEQGKLKPSTLPPISYFSEDLPMLPGEAGTRLLQKVRVGEKMLSPKDGRHRIESVPGKLAVHTQNEAAGLSSFGILQMQWTTGVPTVKDQTQPPQRIAQHRSHDKKQRESRLMSLYSQHGMQPSTSVEEELHLPYLSTASPHISNRHSPGHYEWELPLPPPPAKESRTNVAYIKKEHDNYCKYYQLVKKKLHLYTSQKRESPLRLPEVFVKQLRERQLTQQSNGGNGLEKARRSSSKSTQNGQSLLFPPIKLGQLIKTC